MKQDLSCPIEVRGVMLSRTDGPARAEVRLYNLTRKRIASFEAVAKWHSQASGRSVASPFRADRLRAAGMERFDLTLSAARLADADGLELLFTAVQFEDGESWRAGEGAIVDVPPFQPASGEELLRLKIVAGEDAVCLPMQGGQAWRCVCGRANENGVETCRDCHRQRGLAFAAPLQTPAAPQDPPATEEPAMTRMREGYLRKRARLLRRTLAMTLTALALSALFALAQPAVQPASSDIVQER